MTIPLFGEVIRNPPLIQSLVFLSLIIENKRFRRIQHWIDHKELSLESLVSAAVIWKATDKERETLNAFQILLPCQEIC